MMLKETQLQVSSQKWIEVCNPSKPSICSTQFMVEVVPHFGTSKIHNPKTLPLDHSGSWLRDVQLYRGTVRKATGTCLGQWNNCTFTGQTSTEGVLERHEGLAGRRTTVRVVCLGGHGSGGLSWWMNFSLFSIAKTFSWYETPQFRPMPCANECLMCEHLQISCNTHCGSTLLILSLYLLEEKR